jgi:Ca2+-binding RTX toxin-like protein
MSTFTGWLDSTYSISLEGAHQNVFSRYYTEWLSTEVVGSESVSSWLVTELSSDQLAAFESAEFKVVMNQNSVDGAPYLQFSDGSTFGLEALFAEMSKESFTWQQGKATQERWYFDEFVAPGAPVNQSPTDIHLAIDLVLAASLSSGTTTGVDGATIGTLIATDPDAGDTHTFAIEGDNPGDRFVIDGDQLKLAAGKEIKEGDGTFSVTIKVTDSAGNTYYETFSFTAGGTISRGNNTLDGSEAGGDGILTDPTVGDDVIFGFTGNDTLGTNSTGTSGDDAIFGGAGNDSLFGGDGDDQLFGGDGNDALHGGKGSDVLSGGAGNDTFFWKTGDMDGGAVDTITDWGNGNDKLNIADLLEGFGEDSVLSDFVQVTNDGTHTTVRVDVDGGADNFVDLVVFENVVMDFNNLSGMIVTE